LLSDNEKILPADLSQAADNCRIIAVAPVSMQFVKILDEHFDVIERAGAACMTANLETFHGGEFGVELFLKLIELIFQMPDFLGSEQPLPLCLSLQPF